MRLSSSIGVCFAALIALSGTASAGTMANYDLNKLDNWSDALAVCDVGRFLLTDPDLSADVIFVPGAGHTLAALSAPLYVPLTNFFSDAMRQAFSNVKKAGFVSEQSYSKARLHYASAMLNSYRGASMSDKKFLMDQMDLCYHLAARAGVKLELGK